MIESSMYFGIGLLFGALIGLVLIPLIHAGAVRLTTRRLEAVLPESMAEVQAEKDLLRAEFAMSTRRLEMTVEQLVNKTTSQVAELSKKDNIINKLKVERDAHEIEIITLKTQVDALK
jgi:RecA/RadA recombinase